MHQTTIRKAVTCSGIGLHSGKTVGLTLRPAPEDTGIVFYVNNGGGPKRLTPTPQSVVATGLATTLGNGEATVSTVEHLMAAVRGLEIDNLRIEVEGAELPIMDGSAGSFVLLLRSAGLETLQRPRRVLRIKKPMEFEQDGKWIRAEPYDGFLVDYAIEYAHPLIGRQTLELDLTPESFVRRVAKARTFGFLKDVELMHRHGLALGGSLDNAVVLDEYAVVNPEGLRFKDEFVRHKILDFIGDMALLDAPLQGRFSIHCSGHALNNAFLRVLDENRDLYLQELTLGEERRPAAMPAPRLLEPAMVAA